VFEFVRPSLFQTLKGFNCTIFAYGQTGSGKTHTMFGGDWEENNPAPQVYYNQKPRLSSLAFKSNQGPGIIPNSINSLFQESAGKKLTFYCSFIQIYNEKIFDLLQDPTRAKALKIRENKLYGIFVEGLAEFITENSEDCFLLMSKGDKNRAVRQTRFNHHSSRSHTIFQMLIEADKANKRGALKKAKLNFCDLAGSEKYDKDNDMVEDHIKELTQINKSLSALGKVIHALGTGNNAHVPYRESKLTRLLQDSLAISTRTILIATVSPASVYIEETISTLKFADRARQILVKLKKNEVSATNNQLISNLQREIQHLKTLLNLKRKGGIQELEQKIWVLTEENQKLKTMKNNFTIEEVERLKEENKKLKIELQQAGIQPEDFYMLSREQYTPKSIIKPDSLPDSRMDVKQYDLIRSSSRHEKTKKAKNRIVSKFNTPVLEKLCPHCNSYPPCAHYPLSAPSDQGKVFKAYSTSSAQAGTYRSTNSSLAYSEQYGLKNPEITSKLNVRYKLTNYTVEDAGAAAQLKEQENHKKELQNIKARLQKINELENYRKEQFKKELRILEENKKKDEENAKKKNIEKIKNKKILEEKRKQVEEFKKKKKIHEEIEQVGLMEIKKEAEEKRRKKNEENKKMLAEYYNKKKEEIVEKVSEYL
jgi:Kinesin motor domain